MSSTEAVPLMSDASVSNNNDDNPLGIKNTARRSNDSGQRQLAFRLPLVLLQCQADAAHPFRAVTSGNLCPFPLVNATLTLTWLRATGAPSQYSDFGIDDTCGADQLVTVERVVIVHDFPHIAVHVIETQLIGLFQTHGHGHTIPIVGVRHGWVNPRHLADVIAAGETVVLAAHAAGLRPPPLGDGGQVELTARQLVQARNELLDIFR